MIDQGGRQPGLDRPASRVTGEPAGPLRFGYPAAGAGRRSLVPAALLGTLALCLAAAGPVHAGAAFGVRGGYANVDGDAFRGSGKIGGTPFFGLQAILPILPLVSLVIAGEQRTKEFDFASASFNDLSLRGQAKWTDQALYAAARVRLPGVFGLYGGAGVSLHRQKTDLSGVARVTPTPKTVSAPGDLRPLRGVAAGDPVNDFIRKAEKELTDPAWHAIVGVEFSIPVFPVVVFAEGRVEDIQGSAPAAGAVYAGVNLKLP